VKPCTGLDHRRATRQPPRRLINPSRARVEKGCRVFFHLPISASSTDRRTGSTCVFNVRIINGRLRSHSRVAEARPVALTIKLEQQNCRTADSLSLEEGARLVRSMPTPLWPRPCCAFIRPIAKRIQFRDAENSPFKHVINTNNGITPSVGECQCVGGSKKAWLSTRQASRAQYSSLSSGHSLSRLVAVAWQPLSLSAPRSICLNRYLPPGTTAPGGCLLPRNRIQGYRRPSTEPSFVASCFRMK